MESVIDRLIKFQQSIKEQIGGQNKFELYIGISTGYISNMKKNSGAVSSDVLIKLNHKFPDLNLEWLITGKGSMLKSMGASTNIETEEDSPEDEFYKDIILTYQEMTKEYRKRIEYLEAELAKAAPFAGEEKKKQSKSA